MRLVDKDVLEDAVQGAINIMESQGISMIAASISLAIIKGAPTIDAIPVEWMKKMLEKVNHAAEPHFAFFYVLREWERTKSIEQLQAESEMRDWQKEQEEKI